MNTSPGDSVGRALDVFTRGMWPFLFDEMNLALGSRLAEELERVGYTLAVSRSDGPTDPKTIFSLILDRQLWDTVFSRVLTVQDRAYLFEVKEFRNRWAHKRAIDRADAFRAIDSTIFSSITSLQ